MRALPCLLALALPLAAQASFATTRHAGLPQSGQFGVGHARGDIDGDGDLDLVVAGDFAILRVLINDGSGRFVDDTAARLTTPPIRDCHAIDLADIDGDGDLDVLAANEDSLPNMVFANNGAGVFTDVSSVALPANSFDTKNQVVADLDGDGDVDWLAIDLGGCHYYANNGAGVFVDATATRLVGVSTQLGNEWATMPDAADLDGDGDLDVLAIGPGGLLRNQGGVFSPFPVQLPATATAPHWLADVDGDGDVDLFAASGTRLFLNQGNATFVAVPSFPATPVNRFACFDADRDGDVDVLLATGLLRNDGSGSFAFVAGNHPSPNGGYLGDVVADYDGDGDLELPGLPNQLHHVVAPVPPTLGGNYTVELRTRPGANTLGVVFGAFGPGLTSVGPFGTLRLDPATVLIVHVQLPQPTPTSVTWPLPNLPALVGTTLHYQAIVDDPLVGFVTTNTFRDIVQ